MVYLQQFKKYHNFSPNRFSPTDEEQSTIITEQKARISNVYNKIQKEREAFMKTVG